MHERALMDDLMRKIEEVARADGAARVTRVAVRLGALSHFTPEHFREHFVDASRGTLAEGAEVDAVLDDDLARRARGRASCSRASRSRAVEPVEACVMCLGSIAVLVEAWDDGGARVGRLDDGCVVPLVVRPRGRSRARTCSSTSASRSRCSIPKPRARRSRSATRRLRSMSSARDRHRARLRRPPSISGVSIWVNGRAVKHFGDATVYTTAKNARRRRAPARARCSAGARRARGAPGARR